MVKWVIEGLLSQEAPRPAEPPFVSEPFLTEEGAKHFALLLNERGYTVAARRHGEEGEVVTISGAALVVWMNPE